MKVIGVFIAVMIIVMATTGVTAQSSKAGMIAIFKPSFINKMKDPILDEVLRNLVTSNLTNIADVILKDTEMQFVSEHHDLINIKIKSQEISSISYNSSNC